MLLAGVFIRHFGYWWLAEGTRFSPKAMFYILGGAWETILCLTLLGAFLVTERSVWRYIAIAAMVVGIAEGFQIAACQFIAVTNADAPANTNICDFLIGLPLGPTLASLYLLAIAYGVSKYIRTARAGSS